MILDLLTILGIIYLLLVIISITYYSLISFEKNPSSMADLDFELKKEPSVSIIVPTYNEESNIIDCLQSLRKLEYSNYEIIVSDGGSKDSTVALARTLADKVLVDDNLPEDWVGKNYGCHLASKIAEGELLLFTDADTRHKPNSLKKTVGILESKKVGLVSLLPYQKIERWWESIIPVYFFLSFLASAGNKSINNPDQKNSYLAIGQYLLFSRVAYDRLGGHKRLQGSIIEDFAFARLAKMELNSLYFLENHNFVTARMYPDSLKHCWTGFKKCLYAGTKLTPPRRITFTFMFIMWGIFAPAAITFALFYGSILTFIIFAASLIAYPITIWSYWKGKGKHYWVTYVFLPVLMLIFIFTMISSTLEIIFKKRTSWKGRVYTPDIKSGLEIKEQNRNQVQRIIESKEELPATTVVYQVKKTNFH